MASLSSATTRGKRRRFAPRLEVMEDRSLLAAAVPGVTLDPLLVPKFFNQLRDPLDPSFVFQPTSGNHYEVGAFPIEQDLGLGAKDPVTGKYVGLLDSKGLPVQTKVYGYGTSKDKATFPGHTFVVQSGQAIDVHWTNGLVDTTHLLPVDPTVLDTGGTPGPYYDAKLTNNRWNVTFPTGIPMVPHVHGGHTEAASDGTPQEWFTHGDARVGADFVKDDFTYANTQQAGTIWYHDHAMGVTRLNVYAGLAGFYITHDENENKLIATHKLPDEQFDIPVAIQDRMFTTDGQLYYPADVLEGTTAKYPSEHPESFGDTILVNGQAWPVLDVEPRMYRFRLLNGSNSRFYRLHLTEEGGPTLSQPFIQIGTDQGLLQAPVALSEILIAPGERADVVIDFSKLAGKKLILTNDAPAPFPDGDPVNPGDPASQIMEFRVDKDKSPIPDAVLPKTLNTITPLGPADNTRDLALYFYCFRYSRNSFFSRGKTLRERW